MIAFPPSIKEKFLQVIRKELSLGEFEKWVYQSTELEEIRKGSSRLLTFVVGKFRLNKVNISLEKSHYLPTIRNKIKIDYMKPLVLNLLSIARIIK